MKVKSFIALLLSVVLVATCFSGIMTVSADTEGDYTYTVDANGATITAYNGKASIVNIPKTLGGQPVVAIGDDAFFSKSISTVTMPDTVLELHGAFRYSDVDTITLSKNLKVLGDKTFQGCASLSEIVIPDTVTTIGNKAFDSCEFLTTVNMPNLLKKLGEYAFNNCKRLSCEIVVPNGVTMIPTYCFHGCKKLPAIYFPNGIVIIDEYAFSGCETIAEIQMPAALDELGFYAFQNCTSLQTVITHKITTLNLYAFADSPIKELCLTGGYTTIEYNDMIAFKDTAEQISISSGVTAIGEQAFLNFTKLQKVSLPEGLTEIGDRAFGGCGELSGLVIPDNVTKIGSSVVDSTRFYETASNWENGGLYAGNHLVAVKEGFEGMLIVRDGVRTIADKVFQSTTKMTGLYLPASLRNIGDHAVNSFNYALDVIVYDGTKEDWDNVTIGKSNTQITERTPVYVYGGSYGDVNEDGKVDATDALEILKSVVGKVELSLRQEIVADVDVNGKREAGDALNVLKHVVGKIDRFPAEEPHLRFGTPYRAIGEADGTRVKVTELTFDADGGGLEYVDLTYTSDTSFYDIEALAQIPKIEIDGVTYYEAGGMGGNLLCVEDGSFLVISDILDEEITEIARLQLQENGDLLCVSSNIEEVSLNSLFQLVR